MKYKAFQKSEILQTKWVLANGSDWDINITNLPRTEASRFPFYCYDLELNDRKVNEAMAQLIDAEKLPKAKQNHIYETSYLIKWLGRLGLI